MSTKREPIKKSSIAKKRKIIQEGFKLICQKGYHNVNCIDIAKSANVSTGIIYQYFDNKKDIFINGMYDYLERNITPLINKIEEKIKLEKNKKILIEEILNLYIEMHILSKNAHGEVMAMTWLDQEIKNIFLEVEIKLTYKINELFKNNNINLTNDKEKIHILLNIIDNYCHDYVYHQHDSLNYDILKEETIKISVNLLS